MNRPEVRSPKLLENLTDFTPVSSSLSSQSRDYFLCSEIYTDLSLSAALKIQRDVKSKSKRPRVAHDCFPNSIRSFLCRITNPVISYNQPTFPSYLYQ